MTAAGRSAPILERLVGELGLSPDVAMTPAARSQSPAGVHRVRTAAGEPAYLKTTTPGMGTHALMAARRELRFYRELAARVPCRVPTLLAGYDAEDGVAVLLRPAGRARSPQSWSPAMWTACGTQVAQLHGMSLPAGADWHRTDPLRSAIADPDLPRIAACWAPTVPELPRLLAGADVLLAAASVRPPVFTHGDHHTGNIVFRGGDPALCDWQAAVVGRAVSDLAFLSVRATPSGVTVPPELLAAYCARAGCRPGELDRALVAEELAVYLFQWPHFAHLNSPAAVAHVRRRVRTLVGRWLSARD